MLVVHLSKKGVVFLWLWYKYADLKIAFVVGKSNFECSVGASGPVTVSSRGMVETVGSRCFGYVTYRGGQEANV